MILPSTDVIDLSRLQFGITAVFHFIFAPLTLGLAWILVIMESVYVLTGKVVYKDMTRFWGKLFAINFAMGIVTGVPLEFEFGTNWAYFSRLIGDVFGAALAIEGISAFMLEATFVGLFLVGWRRMNKWLHLMVTFFLAVGSNLSVVNILVANTWMQHPSHSYFNYHTMHFHLTSLWGIYSDHLAQIRVGHVAFAGTLVAALFVIGISAYYLLKKRDIGFAKRSIAIAAAFGLISSLGSIVLGDQNGLAVAKYEPAKMAAIEAAWQQPKAPAAWSLIAFPNQSQQKNYFDIEIPYALSIIATHSLSGTIWGAAQIEKQAKPKIASGWIAYHALRQIRGGHATSNDYRLFNQHKNDLGYGLLLAPYDSKMTKPTAAQLNKASRSVMPRVWVVFWSFRIMIGCWLLMFLLLFLGCYYSWRGTISYHRWWLRLALWCIPIPWIAAEFGWITTEMGRQPWTVHGFLPTSFSASSINSATVAFSLAGFIIFYAVLFIIEMYLMFKYARLGPSVLGEKRYHFEIPPKYMTNQKQQQ